MGKRVRQHGVVVVSNERLGMAMAPQQRSELVQNLEDSREDFIASMEGLKDSQASVRPHPERWSVLECVEHVMAVEERFLGRLESAEKRDTPSVDKQKEAALMLRVPDRSVRVQAPEAVRPTGRFATLGEALAQFNDTRARSIQFAQDRSDDLYCLVSDHPRFGPVNGVEVLILLAGHSRRHAQQIRETRAAVEQS